MDPLLSLGVLGLVSSLSLVGGSELVLEAALVELARAKRQVQGFVVAGGVNADAICVFQCMSQMSSGMEAVAGEPSGLISASLFEEAHLARFCAVYKNGKGCMAACRPSQAQTMLLRAFGSLDFLCIQRYEELLSHLPCFRSSHAAVQAECNPRCGDLKQLKRLQKQQQLAQQLRDLDGMTRTMGSVCQVLDCQVTCQEPIIARACPRDAGAGSFMQGFARQSMLATERMLEEAGASRLWPEACRRLAKDSAAIGDFDPSQEYESYEEEKKIQAIAAEPEPPLPPPPSNDDDYLLAPEDPAQPQRTFPQVAGASGLGLTISLLTLLPLLQALLHH